MKEMTPALEMKIIRLYRDEGKSLREVADELGIKHLRVRNVLIENDIPTRPPDFRRTKRDQRIVDLSKQGKSLSEIGEELGLTRQRVHQLLKREIGDADQK